MNRIAAPIVGGLICSTILTLIVIPVKKVKTNTFIATQEGGWNIIENIDENLGFGNKK